MESALRNKLNKGGFTFRVCLAWMCGGFLLKVQYLLSTNQTSKSYKNMLFTQKSTSYLLFKHPLNGVGKNISKIVIFLFDFILNF
jgi:hypothetical protein